MCGRVGRQADNVGSTGTAGTWENKPTRCANQGEIMVKEGWHGIIAGNCVMSWDVFCKQKVCIIGRQIGQGTKVVWYVIVVRGRVLWNQQKW